jgi:hypothetical protein
VRRPLRRSLASAPWGGRASRAATLHSQSYTTTGGTTDEDGIPTSSDFSNQIKTALVQSDYLIVICSPDTPGSRWVRREIETFQELGKGDQIIPLLIAGEPEDSFPLELLRRRVKRDKPDGTIEEIFEDFEPIAADVRPRSDERKWRKSAPFGPPWLPF